MKKLVQKYWYHIIFFIGIPSFFMGFSFLYNQIGIIDNCRYAGLTSEFHMTMLFCIGVLTLFVFRTVFWLINSKRASKWWEHMLWCLGEIYAVSYFFALYLALFSHRPYFNCLLTSMGYTFMSFIYPYIVLILTQLISEARNASVPSDTDDDLSQLVRFYDDRHKLRLTLDKSAILKIQADFNYVKLYYVDRGEVKSYILRASMKSIETSAEKHGLVRCHRSYFINPEHVRILSRDKDGGINATLDRNDTEPVPVSKKYYGALSDIL